LTSGEAVLVNWDSQSSSLQLSLSNIVVPAIWIGVSVETKMVSALTTICKLVSWASLALILVVHCLVALASWSNNGT
jgi:hypothetical protein